jgi:glycine betaine/proline transport system permease protein
MAAFSMVIIASIIGGFEDIGWEVLASMRKAEFGQSLLSGGVIALLAMLIDRITRGFATGRTTSRLPQPARSRRHRLFIDILFAGGCLAVALALHLLAAADSRWLVPPRGTIDVGALNQAILALVQRYADPVETFKNAVLYAVFLPLRIGLVGAVMPYTWGFALTPPLIAAYWAVVVALAVMAWRLVHWRLAILLLTSALFFYQGFTAFPWPAFILLVTVLAWRAAGWRVALFAGLGLGFMLVTGLWQPLMLSTYLCGLAIVVCLLLGGMLGLWAAHSDRASAVLRAVSDTLQTMPQFVFLIPVLMFFKVGEFTALVAIILYAVVPPIRYVEHGLRHVRPDIVEASRQMGCTPRQMLWLVKFPAALPVIMLGLNQTIMAALSMLVIAAMVGTRDLGQQVYIALGKADAGLGLIAGLSIAFLAMIGDRIIRGWHDRRVQAGGT